MSAGLCGAAARRLLVGGCTWIIAVPVAVFEYRIGYRVQVDEFSRPIVVAWGRCHSWFKKVLPSFSIIADKWRLLTGSLPVDRPLRSQVFLPAAHRCLVKKRQSRAPRISAASSRPYASELLSLRKQLALSSGIGICKRDAIRQSCPESGTGSSNT